MTPDPWRGWLCPRGRWAEPPAGAGAMLPPAGLALLPEEASATPTTPRPGEPCALQARASPCDQAFGGAGTVLPPCTGGAEAPVRAAPPQPLRGSLPPGGSAPWCVGGSGLASAPCAVMPSPPGWRGPGGVTGEPPPRCTRAWCQGGSERERRGLRGAALPGAGRRLAVLLPLPPPLPLPLPRQGSSARPRPPY